MSRHDSTESLHKKRPHSLFSLVLAGLLLCAGLFGTHAPALADQISHIPTIDLYPTVNYATGNDEYGSPGGPDPCNNYSLSAVVCPTGSITSPSAGNAAGGTRPGKLDLNAVISIPILRGLAFQYEHDRAAGIDTTIGRVTTTSISKVTGLPVTANVYPGTSNDIVDTFRLSYTGIKGVGVTLGTFYRFRHDNPATNDVASNGGKPADWHEQFLDVSYTAPAIAALNGLTIGIGATGELNKHHASAQYLAGLVGTGYSDTDGKYVHGINYGANANLPINHGFAVFGSTRYGAFDFFDNSPVPFYYVIDDVGIVKHFNKTLSLTADTNNLTQLNNGSGYPFTVPNTIHRVYFAIALDIHLAP